ncbi:MAG: thiolase family protein [bacterium]|nr:thiolase family protein [bacterium]
MALERTFIPYGAYWSSPFCRWQGSLGHLHSMELAAQVTRRFLADRQIAADSFDGLVLGLTVHQRRRFDGAPWLAGMIGADGVTGPTVAQACATSARMLAAAALEVESGQRESILAVAGDRTSNGPHVYYPNPKGAGGRGESEDPVWDNFNKDPHAGGAMVETAENLVREAGITRRQQDEITVLRCQQYEAALADDRAFQKRYMLPVELTRGKKVTGVVEADEGIYPTTAEGLAKLRPVLEGGTVTFGAQTHPADGNAGMVVCTRQRAAELSRDPAVEIQLLGYGEARVGKGLMPMAVVPAARHALERSGVEVEDCAAIKTHNPFAVNDVYFCRELGVDPENVNRFGSPLVWGHPQAPTGLRAVAELIEELAGRGGGVGLFSGCAAGDTAMAVVLRVTG